MDKKTYIRSVQSASKKSIEISRREMIHMQDEEDCHHASIKKCWSRYRRFREKPESIPLESIPNPEILNSNLENNRKCKTPGYFGRNQITCHEISEVFLVANNSAPAFQSCSPCRSIECRLPCPST